MINRLFAIAWLVACLVAQATAQSGTGFPKGDIKGPFVWKSTIYPGTERDYWVYVPKQYDAAKPACTMILQDGLTRANGWKLPTVLDSLIALKEIPAIIGIFIDHGKVPAAGVDNWPRFNRSFEYDALGDRYARFLIEEIIPEVSKTYNLSKDPNDRSIAGASSGAICAFNAAWERPNEFRRVLSTIGTYVGLRGGDEFPTLVRKTEPKLLRVFLEDGSGDLNIYGGDWWTANQAMLSALTWAGYEVNHAWGTEGHNSKGAVKILPEALKWLWKDYPQPVKTHASPVPRFNPLLENEPWREISLNPQLPDDMRLKRLAVNKNGEIYVATSSGIHKIIENGKTSLFSRIEVEDLAFGPDNKLYCVLYSDKKKGIISFDSEGHMEDVIEGSFFSLLVSNKGIYFTLTHGSEIGFYSFSKKSGVHPKQTISGEGLALSSDQAFLIITNYQPDYRGYSSKVNDDGTLSDMQAYIHYHIPPHVAFSGFEVDFPSGIVVDSENRHYAATKIGIQVSDQLGRVNFIISNPDKFHISALEFGDADLSTLYAIANGKKLYKRKVSTKGVLPFLPPVKPPKPGL